MLPIFLVGGGILGISLAVLTDYWNEREYYRNFKRNLMEFKSIKWKKKI